MRFSVSFCNLYLCNNVSPWREENKVKMRDGGEEEEGGGFANICCESFGNSNYLLEMGLDGIRKLTNFGFLKPKSDFVSETNRSETREKEPEPPLSKIVLEAATNYKEIGKQIMDILGLTKGIKRIEFKQDLVEIIAATDVDALLDKLKKKLKNKVKLVELTYEDEGGEGEKGVVGGGGRQVEKAEKDGEGEGESGEKGEEKDNDNAGEKIELGNSGAHHRPLRQLNCGEQPEVVGDCAMDVEMCKRLIQMVPSQSNPRINGERPSVDEVTSDHQRLLKRLQVFNLVEFKVKGDGNCQLLSVFFPQFRALSDQLYRNPMHHETVRQEIVNQLKSCPDVYKEYVPMAYDDYLKKMSRNGEWGDHVTLKAAAECYGVKILVVTSFKDTWCIEIVPKIQKSERVIFLSFWAEVHYNSVYPEGEVPKFEITGKKRRSVPLAHDFQ